jgi:hypothetical protein
MAIVKVIPLPLLGSAQFSKEEEASPSQARQLPSLSQGLQGCQRLSTGEPLAGSVLGGFSFE